MKANNTLALAVSLTAHTGTGPQRALREALQGLAATQSTPPRVGYVPDRFGDYTGVRAALRGLPAMPVQLLVDPTWLGEERPDVLVVSDVDEVVAFRNYPKSTTASTLRALAAGELPYRLAADVHRIADGDYHHRVVDQHRTELVGIMQSVNRLADRLIANQRMLAENVESLERTNRELIEARDQVIRSARLASVGTLAAEELADVVAYAVSRPRHVNLRQIMAMPTRQA